MSTPVASHVLIVDDEASIRDSTSMLLRSAGYVVRTAEHGFDALLQLGTLASDVIISDLNMPQMSGFEFLSVVRRRFPEIVVIASVAPTNRVTRFPVASLRTPSTPRDVTIPKNSCTRWRSC
jgi:CheY-like chemotaxis protein